MVANGKNADVADGLVLGKDALMPMDAASIAKRDRATRPLQYCGSEQEESGNMTPGA